MKIDFYTEYNPETFKEVCSTASKKGLDGVVSTGFSLNNSTKIKGLWVFPAQLVRWKAAYETKAYDCHEDWQKQKNSSRVTDVLNGKTIIILPDETQQLEFKETELLYDLLQKVSEEKGITISLHENSSWIIPISGNYQFDAVRIRPYNQKDVNSVLPFTQVPVAGTGWGIHHPERVGELYTEFQEPITSNNELIKAIKTKQPTEIYIQPKIPIKNTVVPLKIVVNLKNLGFEN